MALKVIGAGFGRTGTMSLKHALEMLGFDKCYHMIEVMANPDHAAIWSQAHAGEPINWDKLFAGYLASVDWPACNLWREQMEYFPDAKVILSRRDPDRWYDSVMNTIYKSTVMGRESSNETSRTFGEWATEIIWKRVFDEKLDDRAHVIDVYNRHNEEVIQSVPEDRLLVFEPSQGWEPLCRFLDVEIPAENFPRVNTTEEFSQRFIEKN
jgi:hypothetical protein